METKNTKNPIRKIRSYFKKHPKKAWAILIFLLTVLAIATSAVYAVFFGNNAGAPQGIPVISKIIPKEEKFYSPLTGLELKSKEDTKKPVAAVMIENTPEARPQSGLAKAEIVYEAIAEGGITRFLAFYQNEKPELLGPVRSLRDYYVDWLTPYDATVLHVGGSAKSLNRIRSGSYKDADEMLNSGLYWRASDRWAPHNVYTNFENIDKFNESKNFTSSQPKEFKRSDVKDEDNENITASKINLSFGVDKNYNVQYTYQNESKSYQRHFVSYNASPQAHLDREEGQISPAVVITIESPMQAVMEDGYRESIQTIGTGRAHIFQNGQAMEATWKKDSVESQIKFIDKDGKEISLARGKTWISIIPAGKGSVSWQ